MALLCQGNLGIGVRKIWIQFCILLGPQAEALDLDLSVQETLERAAQDAQLNDIKALLGRMMFTGKAVHKRVSHPCMKLMC